MRDRPAAPVSLKGLYLGVFIGPLMGGVTNVMLPVLRDDFTATLGQVTAVVSAYMVPFVLLQLVSGTIADRFSRGGTVTGGCAAFAASAALAAVAPNIELFLAARVVQGAANAFVTPIIMATLGDVVPAPRLGRALGVFTTVNTAGLLLAPLLGGAFAETNWRLVYVLLTAVCTALAAYYAWWYRRLRVSAAPAEQSQSTGLAMLMRGLANRRLVLLCIAGWLGYVGNQRYPVHRSPPPGGRHAAGCGPERRHPRRLWAGGDAGGAMGWTGRRPLGTTHGRCHRHGSYRALHGAPGGRSWSLVLRGRLSRRGRGGGLHVVRPAYAGGRSLADPARWRQLGVQHVSICRGGLCAGALYTTLCRRRGRAGLLGGRRRVAVDRAAHCLAPPGPGRTAGQAVARAWTFGRLPDKGRS